MRKTIKEVLFFLLVAGVMFAFFYCGYRIGQEHAIDVEMVYDTVYVERPSQWDDFVDALVTIESNGNADAVNETTGATGLLQILPCYVQEVNRILGAETYTLDDRYDAVKTMEMFSIYQNYYNPERDIDKAIRLHNPRAGEWYKERVKSKMRTI